MGGQTQVEACLRPPSACDSLTTLCSGGPGVEAGRPRAQENKGGRPGQAGEQARLPVQWGCAGSSELGRDCRPVAKGEEQDETAATQDTREQRWSAKGSHPLGTTLPLGGEPSSLLKQTLPQGLSAEDLGLTERLSGSGRLARGPGVLPCLFLTPSTL